MFLGSRHAVPAGRLPGARLLFLEGALGPIEGRKFSDEKDADAL